MKFDFCIGNPPYQQSDGGAQSSARPTYQYFSLAAKEIAKINCLVQPSRWMTGGKGLDNYRQEMLDDKSIKVLYDYANPKDVFKDVDIKGGVCIYLRDEKYIGECECHRCSTDGESISKRYLRNDNDTIFIREPILISIKNKVQEIQKQNNEEEVVEDKTSPLKPYGLRGDVFKSEEKYNLPPMSKKIITSGYIIIGLGEKNRREIRYVDKNYPFPKNGNINKYKLFVTRNYGCGEIGEIMATPVLATPGMACTETFIEIGAFDTKEELNALYKYFCTKFFRTLVGIRKQDQGASRAVYHYVPWQNFTNNSDIDWLKSISEIDEQLFLKYKLDETEKQFIKEKIKEME